MKKIVFFAFLFFPLISHAAWNRWSPVGSSCDNYDGIAAACANRFANDGYGTIYSTHRSGANQSECGGQPYYSCHVWSPSGSSPCDGTSSVWNQELQRCEYDCDKQGELAGIEEGADSPPGYASQCSSGCAITVSEYFQRSDNGLWVISWIFTGQQCGGGDPLNDPELPPGVEAPDPIDPDTNTDSDDDGEPDFNDGDIDGDGTPNSSDSDADGDGIPNEDDPTPLGGAGEAPTSSASTSSDCRQTPSCAGDAIQCAQLVEIWRLRCKNADNTETEEISDTLDQSIINDVITKGDTALEEYETSAKDAIDTADEVGFDESFIAKVKSKFTFPACSDYSAQFYGHTIAITCGDTAPIRTALGYILFIAVVIGIYNLGHKQPGESK